MIHLQNKLELQRHTWYAWEMIPGYIGEENIPYFSPIFVKELMPRKKGKNILGLKFINVFYAEGVQDFEIDLQILKHSHKYILAELSRGKAGPDRCAVISNIEFGWIEKFCPSLWSHRPPSSFGGEALRSVHIYLSEVFGLGKVC
jgi:hypothetical protein